jgi:hypothetical protein
MALAVTRGRQRATPDTQVDRKHDEGGEADEGVRPVWAPTRRTPTQHGDRKAD